MALKVGELFASFGIDSSGIDGAISGIEKKCAGIASTLAKVGTGLSLALTTPIVAFGKDVFNVGTEFEAQMSRVQGISGATGTELELLTQTAKDLGASSVYSASEAAQGMEYLASAGFDVNEIVSAMPGMLNLAASSGEDLATSAEIAAAMLNGFGLEADQASHVADVLAETAARTNASVYDTGEAMKYVAPLANTMGISMEETAAAIGIMSDAGIKGSQAGTSLRGAFSRMAKPTDVMTDKMDELGISFYDNDGKMKSITETVGMLQDSFVGLTDEQKQNALVTLFGQESLSGWMVLLEAGPEELAAMTSALENCDGAAENMAKTMLDNLKGAIEGFNGSLETAKLNLYDSFAPALQKAVEAATDSVDAFNLLDESSKQVVYKVAALAAAAGPVTIALGGIVGAVGKLIPLMVALASPIGIVAGTLAIFAVAAVDANNEIGKTFTKLSKKVKSSLETINSKITSSIATVSKRMPALCSSIVEGIQDIVPAFMDTALLAVTGFMDTIADNASNIADIGKTIITSILGGISKNLPKLVPAAAKMVTKLATSVINNIPTFVKAVGNLVSSAIQGVKDTDWASLGKEILATIGDSFKEIVTILKGWFEQAKTAIQNIDWGGVWETIKGAFNVASDWLKNLILGDAATDSSTWSDVGAKIWGWIKSGFTATGDWVKKIVLGESYTADAGWDIVGKAVWEKIKSGITATGDWIKSLVLGNAFTADSSWADVGEKIVSKISEGLSSLDFSSDNLTAKIGDVSAFLQNIVKKILESKADHQAAITTFVTNLISSIAAYDGWANLATTFGTIAGAIIGGIADAIPKVADAAVSIIGAFGSMLSSETAGDLTAGMNTIASSIINGIVDAIPKVAGAAVGIIGAIADLLSGEGAKSLLTGMTSIATTIIDGIVQAIPSLTTAASSIVGAIGDLLAGIDWATAIDSVTALGSAIINAIVEGIKGLGNVGLSIVTAIGDLLGKIDWAGVSVSLEGFASMLINGIVEGIKASTTASTNIITALSGILSSIDWQEFGSIAGSLGKTLIDGIVAGIKAAVTGATDIINAITSLFKEIDWKELGNTAADLATTLFDGIVEGLATVDFNSFLTAIGSGIAAAGEGLGEAASSIVNKLVTFIITPENWGKLVTLGAELVKGIAAGIYNLGKGILEGAWGFVKGTLKGLFEGLGFEFNDWSAETEVALSGTVQMIGAEGDQINQSLQTCLANISTIDWAGGMNTESLYNAVQAWQVVLSQGTDELIAGYDEYAWLGCQEITDLFTVLCDETASAADRAAAMIALNDLGLGEFVNASFASCDTEITDAARRMSESGVTTFEEAFALLGITIPEAVQAGLDAGMPLVEAAAAATTAAASTANEKATAEADAKATGEGITTELGGAVSDGESDVETSAEGVVSVTQVVLDTLPDAAAITGEDTVTGMADAIDNNATTVETSMDTLAADVVTAALSEMSYDTGYTLGYDYVDGADNGVSDMQTTIVNTMNAVASAVRQKASSMLSKTNGNKIGTEFGSGVKGGINDVKSSIESAASSAAASAKSAAANALSYSAGSSIGRQFDNGIAAGIKAGSSAIAAAARAAAQAALNAAKNTLGIHSPSTVAEKEIGYMYDEGVANGLLKRMGIIADASRQVSSELHDSFYVGDPSRGTVYTSGDAIQQTARQTAQASADEQSAAERAKAIGTAMADRLIESGALAGDVIMDKEKVGEKVSAPVSKAIRRKTNTTVAGRSAQGVLA